MATKENLEVISREIKDFTDKVTTVLKEIPKDDLYRDLFIVMQRDFHYIIGSYDTRKLAKAQEKFLQIYEKFQSLPTSSTLLHECLYYVSKAIHKTFILKEKLREKFSQYFNVQSYLNEEQLVEIDRILKTNNLAKELQDCKHEALYSMHYGLLSCLLFIWDKNDLTYYHHERTGNEATEIIQGMCAFKATFYGKHSYMSSIELLFKHSTLALDLHELFDFVVCIMRANLRFKNVRTFKDQETRPKNVDALLFTVIDLLKLQIINISSMKPFNVRSLNSYIEFAYPVQCLLFISLVYFLKNADPQNEIFTTNNFHDDIQMYVFKSAGHHEYNHYVRNLWHISLRDKQPYYTYLGFIKIYNKLKSFASVYSKKCTSCRRLSGDNSTFGETIDTPKAMYDYFHHFLNNSLVIFKHTDDYNYKEIYSIRQSLRERPSYDPTKANFLILSKESLVERSNDFGIFLDVYIKFVEFYDLTDMLVSKLKEIKVDGRLAFDALCQETTQLIRDLTVLFFKSSIWIVDYIIEKCDLMNSKMSSNEQRAGVDLCALLEFAHKELQTIFEKLGVCDKYGQDVETFLQSDFKDVFLYYTLLALELLMVKTDFDWSAASELKLVLHEMLKLIKIIPNLNTYFRYYETGASAYFKQFCFAYNTCLVNFGQLTLNMYSSMNNS